jgi:hypothetical protein
MHPRTVLALVLAAALCAALVLVAAGEGGSDARGAAAEPAPCPGKPTKAQARQIEAYAHAGGYPARQVDERSGLPRRVGVTIPPIRFTGEGESATLPTDPCQYIYRYRYATVRATHGETPSPFRYVEVDWNTEGRARGPNGSFKSPHFDFHLYLKPRSWVDAHTKCRSTNGKTCDPLKTRYAQMRRFLDMPAARLVPRMYRPDVDSSIPAMGLHLLDAKATYTVPAVNHHPVLIYGTFDGRILFAEASVTLFTLQDAMAAKGHVACFPFRQPPRHMSPGLPWPSAFTIRYSPSNRTFEAGFENFSRKPGSKSPPPGCAAVLG